eukprot:Lankesteria_metandrocarpae@DN5451_c1_g2_i1.p1
MFEGQAIEEEISKILSWDIFDIRNTKLLNSQTPYKLPLQYKNHADYVEILKPLALEECRASIERECMTCRLEGKSVIVGPFMESFVDDMHNFTHIRVGRRNRTERPLRPTQDKDALLPGDLVLVVLDNKSFTRGVEKKTIFDCKRP